MHQSYYFLVFSMSSFVVSDYLDAMWHAGFQRFTVLQDDFSVPNFLNSLSQNLSTWWLVVCYLILQNSSQLVDWIEIWAVSGPFQNKYLVFLQEVSNYFWLVTRSTTLHEDRAALDVHVQFQLLSTYLCPFMLVLGEMKYRPVAPPRHKIGTQIICSWVFHWQNAYPRAV